MPYTSPLYFYKTSATSATISTTATARIWRCAARTTSPITTRWKTVQAGTTNTRALIAPTPTEWRITTIAR
ncbi:hypothetical protein [Sodalis sp. RH16]|uniref:hypothetical protein n=1 Tax=Sodalis sp. RH16 TaxID=3394331 RepID=UPI0039B6C47E